ncbi:hypothetical protein MPTK1_2g06790 [Marchantia polymorpha subsp. ruderalis]|uniref:Uncharacterized protein n=1 Tax=Marchantia polymorpha TaxID=3197 RepID=A0A2R6XDV0_MARPO|nr:hypothetical protein MARPO_0021s0132 [Marchantia polymorpha]BBN01352.1 hypothetical protein Mp_2g06790 [Marchantia polymorpha subsp. ruderalis]|eukprot:PTQ44278.1 hypothetical protein MARPO_0021s0132 [Marchantia polymorpha]
MSHLDYYLYQCIKSRLWFIFYDTNLLDTGSHEKYSNGIPTDRPTCRSADAEADRIINYLSSY